MAARYWRLVGLAAAGGGKLSLSAVHFRDASGVRIGASATVTATVTPDEGALDALMQPMGGADEVAWASAVPSLSIVWDMGEVVEPLVVVFGGVDIGSEQLDAVLIEYSADGLQWSSSWGAVGFVYWEDGLGLVGPKVGGGLVMAPGMLSAAIPHTLAGDVSVVDGAWHFPGKVFDRVVIAPNAAFSFGAGDFCLEARCTLLSRGVDRGILDFRPSVGAPFTFFVDVNTGKLALWDGASLHGAQGSVVPFGEEVHVAADRTGGILRIFLNGVLQFSASYPKSLLNNRPLGIGGNAVDGTSPWSGSIRWVRVTVGSGRYAAAFTPPMDVVGYVREVSVRHAMSASRIDAVLPVQPATLQVDSQGGVIDIEVGGRGRIHGTVEQKLTGDTTLPLKRRVRLHRSRDGLLVRETWSDAQGNYRFDGLSTRYEYDVIAWDHEGQFRSTIANNLKPEVLP